VHQLLDKSSGACVDLLGESYAASLDLVEHCFAQCGALVAPGEPVERRALADRVQLCLLLETEQSESSSLLVFAHDLAENRGLEDLALLSKRGNTLEW